MLPAYGACAVLALGLVLLGTFDDLVAGSFHWRAGQPLVAPAPPPGETWTALKDPSVVFQDGRWHLFCTLRAPKVPTRIVYLSFTDWADAGRARQEVLPFRTKSCGAPEVFYFAPQKVWYLICQASDDAWEPKYQAAYSTSEDIGGPAAWAPLRPLGARPAGDKVGLDFWVICDDANAYLFFTTLDGHVWREQTRLADFRSGWSEPTLVISGDIFEAGHTYALKGTGKYLTLVEAQGGRGWRYYKAYLADRLDGEWRPIAATREKCFASMANVEQPGGHWTDSISHGELIRAGADQRLEVEPSHLRFVFQGVSDAARAGKAYADIPWRLGMLEEEPTPEQRDH
jgi:hypothetical protein